MHQHYLHALFAPTSVALFGATDKHGSVGATLTQHLFGNTFQGTAYAINPGHKKVHGIKCYANLEELPTTVDLAVITTPAQTVPGIIEQCGKNGVKAAVILTAGFREVGAEGRKLENQVLALAHHYGIRFIGPNCLGIMRPELGFNATFSKGMAKPGSLALVSQSGAICTAILDWAQDADVGFSSVVSLGASADINFGEVLDYLVADPQTKAILLYIEGIEDARRFMSALRAAASSKPVVALKVGRHQAGSQAAKSHTGALAGNDAVFDSALRRAGVVRGYRINDLFIAATVLSRDIKLRGEQLLIVTNGGGPAVMACDRASDLNVPLVKLPAETIAALDRVLPATWSHQNPVDIIGDADPVRYQKALDIALADDTAAAALVILAPTAINDPSAVAHALIETSRRVSKPVLACWMGGNQVTEGRRLLNDAGIPCFNTPEAAIDAYSYLINFYRNQQLLAEVPESVGQHRKPDVEGARLIIETALQQQRDTLTELEAKAVLSAFRIPVNRTAIAHDINEALLLAESIGFPIVMKVQSKQITHKSDVGGVRVGINDAAQVRSAYKEIMASCRAANPDATIDGVTVQAMYQSRHSREVMVGAVTDPLFGPVISFGAGGTNVEVVRDSALALPPLNSVLAQDLINRTRVSRLLKAYRNVPAANTEALVDVLLRLSEMLCELPMIREIDMNPLLVDENQVIAVDARIIVGHGHYQAERFSHLAIHPYPDYLSETCQLSDGTDVLIRPVKPEDSHREQVFVRSLSKQSKYFRFMQNLKELTPAMLRRFTHIDYDREMALLAVTTGNGEEQEIGVSRYVTNPDGMSCEFAVVVADAWQNQGIAWRLMDRLINIARHRGLQEMEGTVLRSNAEMLEFCKRLGFIQEEMREEPNLVRVVKKLQL